MKNAPADWDIDTEYKDVGTVNCWTEIKEAAKAQNEPELLTLGAESASPLCIWSSTASARSSRPLAWSSKAPADSSSPNRYSPHRS